MIFDKQSHTRRSEDES